MPLRTPLNGPSWLPDFARSIEGALRRRITAEAFTVATLPAAGPSLGQFILVTDEAGGCVPAFSDGTDWRRVTDRAVVS